MSVSPTVYKRLIEWSSRASQTNRRNINRTRPQASDQTECQTAISLSAECQPRCFRPGEITCRCQWNDRQPLSQWCVGEVARKYSITPRVYHPETPSWCQGINIKCPASQDAPGHFKWTTPGTLGWPWRAGNSSWIPLRRNATDNRSFRPNFKLVTFFI